MYVTNSNLRDISIWQFKIPNALPMYHFDPVIQFILQSKEFIAMLASAAVPICKKKWSKESVVPKCVKL